MISVNAASLEVEIETLLARGKRVEHELDVWIARLQARLAINSLNGSLSLPFEPKSPVQYLLSRPEEWSPVSEPTSNTEEDDTCQLPAVSHLISRDDDTDDYLTCSFESLDPTFSMEGAPRLAAIDEDLEEDPWPMDDLNVSPSFPTAPVASNFPLPRQSCEKRPCHIRAFRFEPIELEEELETSEVEGSESDILQSPSGLHFMFKPETISQASRTYI